MKKVASFLLGSGFSIPAGLPSVAKINERMGKIDEEEIMIHSSMYAWFLKAPLPNNYSRRIERLFIQKFLEFYNSKVLKTGEDFHYEEFYDFYSLYLSKSLNNTVIEDFIDQFKKEFANTKYTSDYYNTVSSFNRTYNY
jgi:hypothetical protein